MCPPVMCVGVWVCTYVYVCVLQDTDRHIWKDKECLCRCYGCPIRAEMQKPQLLNKYCSTLPLECSNGRIDFQGLTSASLAVYIND